MDELEDERAAGDDALPAREEVAADDPARVSMRSGERADAAYVSRTLDLPADWLPTYRTHITK